MLGLFLKDNMFSCVKVEAEHFNWSEIHLPPEVFLPKFFLIFDP